MKMRGWTICPLGAVELLIDYADGGTPSPEITLAGLHTAGEVAGPLPIFMSPEKLQAMLAPLR